jgi:hypothetical protein
LKRLLLPLLAAFALPTAVNSGMRFERIPTGYCSTSQKKAPKGSDCFSFAETNDGDPSVYILGKKYPNLESKKSLKPISWGGPGATQGNYLTRYTMEIRIHYLENEARKTKGLKKLNWDERTNKGRHEFSRW